MKIWYPVIAILALSATGFIYENCSSSTSNADPVAAAVGNISQKIVLLRDGFNGYTGTRDTTIYIDAADWNSTSIIGPASSAERVAAIVTVPNTNAERAFGLLHFDVSGVADDLLKGGDTCAANLEVAQAQVTLTATPGAATAFASLTPLKVDAPLWTEAEATYTMANASIAWPTTPNASQFAINSTDVGYGDNVMGASNSAMYRTITYNILADRVKDWICDSTKNKGMLFRYHSSTSGNAQFFSRNFSERGFRPLLTLWLRRI